MPSPPRLAPLILLLFAAPLGAQTSAYVPLDDPLLPAFEHLVARGEVDDPTPQQRPFRRHDALAALDSAVARGTLADAPLAGRLRAAWAEDTAEARWHLGIAGGGQGYTEARRDLLHPAGPRGVRPLAQATVEAAYGPVVLVTRPTVEPRLPKDPDWPGRKDIKVAGWHPEAYLALQFKYGELSYGQMEQNWGPGLFPGIGVSNAGYPRPYLGLRIGTRAVGLVAQAATLEDAVDSSGTTINRYFFFHRLHARLSHRFELGLWETTVLAGPGRSFGGRYRNPVTLLLLANEYGLGDNGNILLGLDATWRVGRARLMAQLGLDDFQYHPGTAPNRYAFALQAEGPLGRRLAWRAGYTQASSLAFRTSRQFESFTDQGVGLGRNFADNDQMTVQLSVPGPAGWMLTPELTLLRQGEGTINGAWPTGQALADTPTLFIGTVTRTWRAALGVAGHEGPFALHLNAGVHRLQNAGHVEGRSRTRFVGRVQATLGTDWRGHFSHGD